MMREAEDAQRGNFYDAMVFDILSPERDLDWFELCDCIYYEKPMQDVIIEWLKRKKWYGQAFPRNNKEEILTGINWLIDIYSQVNSIKQYKQLNSVLKQFGLECVDTDEHGRMTKKLKLENGYALIRRRE